MSEPPVPATNSKWFSTNATQVSDPDWNASGYFSGKNLFIAVLLIIIFLSLIGINLLNISGQIVDGLIHIFGPTIKHVFAILGISTGELIKTSADVAASAANLGVDIAKGATHSIGDLLINSGEGGMDEEEKRRLDQALKSPKCDDNDRRTEPSPIQSSEPTVAPIGSQKAKAGWCYIGDYAGSRGCVAIEEHNKCMSGQVFPSQSACLYPRDDGSQDQ